MSRTAIRELPDTFSQLANLRVLKLDFCFNLTKIASSVSNCVKLESISCNNCKLNRADSLPNLSSTRLNQLLLPENNIRTVANWSLPIVNQPSCTWFDTRFVFQLYFRPTSLFCPDCQTLLDRILQPQFRFISHLLCKHVQSHIIDLHIF